MASEKKTHTHIITQAVIESTRAVTMAVREAEAQLKAEDQCMQHQEQVGQHWDSQNLIGRHKVSINKQFQNQSKKHIHNKQL